MLVLLVVPGVVLGMVLVVLVVLWRVPVVLGMVRFVLRLVLVCSWFWWLWRWS